MEIVGGGGGGGGGGEYWEKRKYWRTELKIEKGKIVKERVENWEEENIEGEG